MRQQPPLDAVSPDCHYIVCDNNVPKFQTVLVVAALVGGPDVVQRKPTEPPWTRGGFSFWDRCLVTEVAVLLFCRTWLYN